MTTRVNDAIAALLTLLSTPTVTDAVADRTVIIIDGPFPPGDTPPMRLHVGWDGTSSRTAVQDWRQEWRGLGAHRRSERFTVLCCVLIDAGVRPLADARADALAVLAAAEDVLRSPDNIRLGLPPPTTAELASGQLYQEQGARSSVLARVPFYVAVSTRT